MNPDKSFSKTNRAESNSIHKKTFFEKLAFAHLPEMRLLFRGGKLTKRDNWRNVAEHCLVQVAAAEVLSEMLGLSEEDKRKLTVVAASHDWAKRMDIKPGDFTTDEKAKAQEFLERVKPDKDLLAATGMDFLEKALVLRNSTLLERLQFYIDDITRGSDIVPVDERIDEVEARRQDLNNDAGLTARLGGRYWDKERELDHQVEHEIFEVLKQKGVDIDAPGEVPVLLRRAIESEIGKYGD